MKRKLNSLFILITLSLTGIIVFQVYWAVNAYQVNKNKFDADIDVAMQKAMDDCKKDYFDSIRVVMVKRLSDTGTKIKIDTLHLEESSSVSSPKTNTGLKVNFTAKSTTAELAITVSDKYTGLQPFNITTGDFDFYRAKIPHKNATVAEVVVEMSFYIPTVLNNLELLFGMHDFATHTLTFKQSITKNKKGTPVLSSKLNEFGIFQSPPNFRQADSSRLSRHLRAELDKMHIPSPFNLKVSDNATKPQKLNMHYSETGEYSYKYHGFVFLHMTGAEFFMRAVFGNPQYAILKGMIIILLLSALLIALTIYCFNYIIRLVIHQKKLGELKDDFINNMTHELKTPIATITVAIEGLQKFNALNDVEKTQRYLQTSRRELSRLNDLVTKVLNVAAFESKDIELSRENINVDDLINDIIASEKLKTDKDLNFSYTNANQISTIYADRLHFRNVLANIVDNAVKYSAEPINITIKCFKSDGNAVFSIKDNGIGIPAAHMDQIFDKFHRVPTGNIHNVKGTGLGLSYAKYIVTAHGGDITVKSEINKGSEFIVSIPLKNG